MKVSYNQAEVHSFGMVCSTDILVAQSGCGDVVTPQWLQTAVNARNVTIDRAGFRQNDFVVILAESLLAMESSNTICLLDSRIISGLLLLRRMCADYQT